MQQDVRDELSQEGKPHPRQDTHTHTHEHDRQTDRNRQESSGKMRERKKHRVNTGKSLTTALTQRA